MHLSTRLDAIRPSSTVAVASRARALARQGVDVLAFAAGEPDFDTPAPITDAAVEALRAHMTRYAPTAGDPDARAAIASKLLRDNHLPDITPDHVVISAGAKQSLYLAFQALLDPRTPAAGPAGGSGGDANGPDEVVLPVPAWVSFAPMAVLAGGRVVELPTTPERDFKVTPEQLDAAITPRTRIVVINSPSNPCGTMYTPAELGALADVMARAARARAPRLVVVSDEMYEKIVFGGIPQASIGADPAIAERTVTVNGLSKSYAMTGWRVGYAAAPGALGKAIAAAFVTLQGHMTTSIPSFIYPAIRVALERCDADIARMCAAFRERAALSHALFAALPGVRAPRPTGAFYIFADVGAYLGRTSAGGRPMHTAAQFAEALLEEARVAVVPGEDFGGCGAQCIRFSFACGEPQIREGVARIARFVESVR